MSIQQLLKPITEGGIHSTHYFNGRRLTAEDLDREKKANRQHERLLGQAIGEGVVYGLEVGLPGGKDSGGTTLEIQKGLAVNRNGDALYLPDKTSLSLVPPYDEEQIQKFKFKDCSKVEPMELPRNTGVYVLLIRPADELSGLASMSSIPNNGSIIGCGKSELVEGVQFKVVKMDLEGPAFDGLDESTKTKLMKVAAETDKKSISMFKNIVAHACYGTEEINKFIEDPFGGSDFSNYGAIDRLRSLDEESKYKIAEFEVPLAILRWTQEKIQFVDMWSVRRQGHGLVSLKTWPAINSQRRLAEAEAMFFQFQEQITKLISILTNISSISARNYFRYLPPIGLLPMRGDEQSDGLRLASFFSGRTYRPPVYIEGARFSNLVLSSFNFPAIDLSGKELIWIYAVRENQQQVGSPATASARPLLMFASGHLPYYAESRFNINHWSYSNYSFV
jgi:hypothetical protein